MALFTVKPTSVTKQIPAAFTIDYAELSAFDAVPAGYYKDVSNWKEVFIRVRHQGSNQKGTIHFKRPGDVGELLLTDAARAGTWGIEAILIRDFDRGEVPVKESDIPDVGNYTFTVKSNSSHGDLYVANGQTVTIPAGSKQQYGDFVIEAGGILKLGNGGGVTEIEITEQCLINGTIEANNGTHMSGTWSSTSVLGEALSYTIVQKAGGVGGKGQDASTVLYTGNATAHSSMMVHFDIIPAGLDFGTVIRIGSSDYIVTDFVETGVAGNVQVHANHGYLSSTVVAVTVSNAQAGGLGGLASDGNGGGGGRSAKFGALVGGTAVSNQAGIGAGQNDAPADAYGEDGVPSIDAAEAGSGGFRGSHGQGIYIKARKIQGTGIIDASGKKGGDGGNGGEYNSSGVFFGNAAGGGSAGGSAGKIWLRYKIGTPALQLRVFPGDKGNRGTKPNASTGEAGHGEAGESGSTDVQVWQ